MNLLCSCVFYMYGFEFLPFTRVKPNAMEREVKVQIQAYDLKSRMAI